MTVQELIEKLQTVDQTANVFVGGYEGGLHDISPTFFVEDVRLNVNDPDQWYYGPHELDSRVGTVIGQVDIVEPVKGIIIS
jgi:hypothetical protein